MLHVKQIPLLEDNYSYLLQDKTKGINAIVDPADDIPVLEYLEERNIPLHYILNTHHHFDHTGSNLIIKKETKCKIIGAKEDKGRIPGIDEVVEEGNSVFVGENEGKVLFVPGHTKGHIAYWFPESKALFCGDTLFSLGCGYLFEGTPQQMWNSLEKIKKLPKETKIYCAHEYTLKNAVFAKDIDPDNIDLKNYVKKCEDLIKQGKPTVPSLLEEELNANPFLRVDKESIQKKLGLEGAELWEVFAKVREWRNRY